MRVEARSIGPIAELTLQRPTIARVIAGFEHSFYLVECPQHSIPAASTGIDGIRPSFRTLSPDRFVGERQPETDHGLICVASDGLYDGPINLLLRESDRSWSDLRIAVGQRWIVGGDLLSRIEGPNLDIDLRAARDWRPRPKTGPFHRQKVAPGLNELRRLAADSHDRSDGLLGLVLNPDIEPTSATERAAKAPLHRVRTLAAAWLSDGEPHIASGLDDLLGLGPGLTPSGDDLIAGFLIACRHTGHDKVAQDLWRRLESTARERTTPISFAHLSAAGQGLGAAPFHDLLDALLRNRNDRIAKTLDAVSGIGHCSGLDAVGGLIMQLDAWMGVSDSRHAAA